MATTIKVNKEFIEKDPMKLSAETRRGIERAKADIKAGRVLTHKQVKKKLGICGL